MKRIALVLAVALFVAACGAGFGIRTDHVGDVGSICDESYGEYEGYRLHCERMDRQSVRPRCPASERAQAKAVRDKAANFCAANPADTPANRATIRALADELFLIGRQP